MTSGAADVVGKLRKMADRIQSTAHLVYMLPARSAHRHPHPQARALPWQLDGALTTGNPQRVCHTTCSESQDCNRVSGKSHLLLQGLIWAPCTTRTGCRQGTVTLPEGVD